MGVRLQYGKISPLHDSNWFRRVWSCGVSADEIGKAAGLGPATVMRRAKSFGYPARSGRSGAPQGPMPTIAPAFPGWVPEGVEKPAPQLGATGRAVLASGQAFDAQDSLRWPEDLDVAVATSAGRYAALSEIAKTFDRPVTAVMQRWHQMRAG